MSNLQVHAEALVAAVARAFYDDEAVCLIDVLIADKYLRDDDMAKRLQLPAKRLRATLQFLTEEHLVRHEMVDDLKEGGSQASKFYYIDYNRAVHSIRLRIHLLRKKFQSQEIQARSNSFYLCPGHDKRRCNGKYTDIEAQLMVDPESGEFLCQDCSRLFENDPNPPPRDEYTLKLVDNEKDLQLAEANKRRLEVQLNGKTIGNHQLRVGIFDLLSKTKVGKGKTPITSNYPSENYAVGIGSQRIEGTGRTAGTKASQMQKKGLAATEEEARDLLVGRGRRNTSQDGEENLMHLKSAHGHEIKLIVERGAGSQARVLARQKLRSRGLMDAAASRVGTALPIPIRVEQALKRKAQAAAAAAAAAAEEAARSNKRPKTVASSVPDFLLDNIGRAAHERTTAEDIDDWDALGGDENEESISNNNNTNGIDGKKDIVWADDMEEWVQMPEDDRTTAFQAQYKLEMARQEKILKLAGPASPRAHDNSSRGGDDSSVAWEDGDLN